MLIDLLWLLAGVALLAFWVGIILRVVAMVGLALVMLGHCRRWEAFQR